MSGEFKALGSYAGPNIVNSNMFLYLDAKNPVATNNGGDFLYSSVSMLLLGETTADSSSNAVTMTATGSAAASSTQYKYGSKSLYFGGAGNYLSTPNATIFQLGSGDWTIECWVYITSNSGYNGIISKRNSGTYDAYCLGTDSNNQFWITITNTAGTWTLGGVTLGTGVTPNTWHHLAAVRSGNTITGYVDGVPGTPQTFTGSVYDSGKSVYIGNSDGGGSTQNFNGYIDDFRITKGYARYTSQFTPPTNQLPNYTMSSWPDLSGNGNNATLSGGCHILSDSMYYNGSGNASVTGLNTTLYALEVVFRNYQALNSSPETDNSPYYSLLGFVSNGANTRTIGLGGWTGAYSGETISWWTNYPGSYGSYITDNISYGFHHLFINYNGTTYDIWVDGTKRTVGNASGATLMTNLTSITVGYSAWSSYYFKGDIALVRAYNAALTDAQVLQNFSAVRGRFGL